MAADEARLNPTAPKSPSARLEAEIELTRVEMDRTIDQLRSELRPGRITGRLLDGAVRRPAILMVAAAASGFILGRLVAGRRP